MIRPKCPSPPSRFTGKERDSETGLDDFGARYYNSNLGRWITPDWSAKAAAVPYATLANPQTLNLYAYVANNPTTLADPDGHLTPEILQDVPGSYDPNITKQNPQPPNTVPPSAKTDPVKAAPPKKSLLDRIVDALKGPAPAPEKAHAPGPQPTALLRTDMQGHTTTLYTADSNGRLTTVQIETRTDVANGAKPGADDSYTTHDIVGVSNRHAGTDAYGPQGAFIDTGDPRGQDIHGGGTGLPDPQAPQQGWRPTLGCTRGQNADVQTLGSAITQFQRANPNVAIPYARE